MESITDSVVRDESITCPECGAGMIERKSRAGRFMGCTKYPKCKGSRPIKEDNLDTTQQEKTFEKLRKVFEFIREFGGVTRAYHWLKIAESTIDTATAQDPD